MMFDPYLALGSRPLHYGTTAVNAAAAEPPQSSVEDPMDAPDDDEEISYFGESVYQTAPLPAHR